MLEDEELRSRRVQAYGIWWVTLISLGFALRTICAVSASSVNGTARGELNELVEDEEWNVETDDIEIRSLFFLFFLEVCENKYRNDENTNRRG